MCGIRGRKPVTCASLQWRSLSLYLSKWRGVIANRGHFGAHVKWAHFSNSFPNESCVNSEDGYSRGWEGEDAVSYTCSWGDGILWGSRTGRTGLDHSPGTLQVSRSGAGFLSGQLKGPFGFSTVILHLQSTPQCWEQPDAHLQRQSEVLEQGGWAEL